jgi:hypothetical protein
MIIPIGVQCTASSCVLNRLNLRTDAYPFDFALTPPDKMTDIVIKLIESEGNTSIIRSMNDELFFGNLNKCKVSYPERYHSDPDGNASVNVNTKVVFPHHSYNPETVEAFVRRFERLYKTMTTSHTHLLYIDSHGAATAMHYDDVPLVDSPLHHICRLSEFLDEKRIAHTIIYVSWRDEQKAANCPNVVAHKLDQHVLFAEEHTGSLISIVQNTL